MRLKSYGVSVPVSTAAWMSPTVDGRWMVEHRDGVTYHDTEGQALDHWSALTGRSTAGVVAEARCAK